MTTEQINALAKEYAERVTKDMSKTFGESSPMLQDTIRINVNYVTIFLRWLSERYCIVEKSKVLETHETFHKKWIESVLNVVSHDNLIRMETMEQIFGKNMFEEGGIANENQPGYMPTLFLRAMREAGQHRMAGDISPSVCAERTNCGDTPDTMPRL